LRRVNFQEFRFAEKVKSTMSSYLSAIAVLMLVLSPLFVPVAVTLAPAVFAGVRRAIDLCMPGDPVCSPGGGMSVPLRDEMFSGPHVSYVKSGMANEGATFAAGRL
jgi:hypothetical protein